MEKFREEEKVREEKLKANPKGFHIEGAGYTCPICGDHTPEGDNWYDEWGIKCLVCQKAIDEGEIPASLAKDKESWYTSWELDHYFNLKSPTLRKWVRNGLLKPRIVSNYGKGVHAELFLVEDNKDFLPPKKLVESKPAREIKDGKEYHTTAKWYQLVKDPYEYLKGYKIMEHMRMVPPEEMAAREAEKQKKWEEKQARRNAKVKRIVKNEQGDDVTL